MEVEKVRLFVGGLAAHVSASDLQERFAPLGNVQSIMLPPAKGGPGHRGFAYVDFVPTTDANLRKLFSAYNGCKWRGGFLRIEKAKEHFADRLRREWAVEADSLTRTPANDVNVHQQSLSGSSGQKLVNGENKGDMELSGLKIFFPSLKKVRTVPLKGLGKHKRSFQRVESSPLHLLSTCACDESLRCGSCHCSKIDRDGGSLEVNTLLEGDDISLGIVKERGRQLELLSRLFPSDAPSASFEQQEAVELEGTVEVKGRRKLDVSVGNAEKSFFTPTMVSQHQGHAETVLPEGSLQGSDTQSILKKQSDELCKKEDFVKMDIGMEDDSTIVALAEERAKQLELLNQLFPSDTPSTREPELVVEPEESKIKRRKKQKASGDSGEKIKPMSEIAKRGIIRG